MKLNQLKITQLYKNEQGMSFLWNETYEGHPYHNIINIIINDIGLHLHKTEVDIFLQKIEIAVNRPHTCCGKDPENCKSMLLETPMSQLSMVVSYTELLAIQDLLKGTSFELELKEFLEDL